MDKTRTYLTFRKNIRKEMGNNMKFKKAIPLLLISIMILSLISCTQQTVLPQAESEIQNENNTIQENVAKGDNSLDKNSQKQFEEFLNKEKPTSGKNGSSQQTLNINQKTEEQIKNIAYEAFEVWKAFDQRIWMIFSNREHLTPSNLVDIYSRYCMNTPEKENLLTPENAPEEEKEYYMGGTFFEAEGFHTFSQNYFGINTEDFTTESPSYCPELDAYQLSPTPPIPIEILLKDYRSERDKIILTVDYNDNLSHSYQECCVTGIMTDDGFYFDSCELLYNSEE